MKSQFPVRRPWWFRQITPAGHQPVAGGVRWRYTDFKPREPISIRYYVTQLPRLPEDVDAFVAHLPRSDLAFVREVLLATFGKEPENDTARAFAAAQVWYAPRKDFSPDALSPTQRAVIEAFDRRVGALEPAKGP